MDAIRRVLVARGYPQSVIDRAMASLNQCGTLAEAVLAIPQAVDAAIVDAAAGRLYEGICVSIGAEAVRYDWSASPHEWPMDDSLESPLSAGCDIVIEKWPILEALETILSFSGRWCR